MRVLVAASLLVAVTHAAQNETRALADNSMCLTPDWHVDYPGNDLTPQSTRGYSECCDACTTIPACGAYTWTSYNGGSCYLKYARTGSEWKGTNADGSAHTISGEVYRCGALLKDTDFVGMEVYSQQAPRAESCCQICHNTRLCRGYSWSDYNGGTCWFKGDGLQPVYKPGVVSAYRFPGVTG